MFRFLTGLVIACLATAATPLALGGEESRPPASVAQALKAAGIPTAAVAIHVQEIGARSARLQVNGDQAMNPASVMKLVTTYAALDLLGPAYRWRTELLASAEPNGGTLDGDLYIKGSGDPRLTFEELWLALRQLRARGVQRIRGALVLDRSRFDIAQHDPGRFDQEPLRAYNVGPDALLVNFKALRFDFAPDAHSGKVMLRFEPKPFQLDVFNLLKAGPGACNDWKDGIRIDVSGERGRMKMIFSGSIPAACGERDWHLGVLDHPNFVYGVFRALWEELGGTLEGEWRNGPVPANATLLVSHESAPLAEVVRDINKWSNNVMARQLFLTLGAEFSGRPARPEDGAAAIRAWLAKRRLAMPELVIENGAGLSRAARLSAASLAMLLQSAFASRVMPEFVASLPVSATDGTMRKRLVENAAAGHAHIKTGSLEGVKSIAGYLLDSKGRRWTVVFLVNHPNAPAAAAAQDALLDWIYAGGR